MLVWALRPGRAGGTGAQIDIDRIEKAHDVLIGTECRHDEVLGGIDASPAIGHDRGKVIVVHRFQRIRECRSEGRALTAGSVALHAIGGIADITLERVPVDGSIRGDLERRIASGIDILATFRLNRRRVARRLRSSWPDYSNREENSNAGARHDQRTT